MSIEAKTGPLECLVGRAALDADVDTMRDVYMLGKQRAALERLQADALRYRWLRSEAVHFGHADGRASPWVVVGTCADDATPHWEQDLDAMIDAAIREADQPPNAGVKRLPAE